MTTILMPINPEHAGKIFSGEKKFEFGTRAPSDAVCKILIYETAPVDMVTGEAETDYTISGRPEYVWTFTETGAGVTKEFYDGYFRGKPNAVALHIKSAVKYPEAKPLSDYGIKMPPRSFVYIYKTKKGS
ncbi:MAG: hypothetical protein LUD72_07055 [Bacteroidales bacterium]|nr:hypothetical protein [Bacteroidales bacterium]